MFSRKKKQTKRMIKQIRSAIYLSAQRQNCATLVSRFLFKRIIKECVQAYNSYVARQSFEEEKIIVPITVFISDCCFTNQFVVTNFIKSAPDYYRRSSTGALIPIYNKIR